MGIEVFLTLGFLDGIAGWRWHFSALAYARRVRAGPCGTTLAPAFGRDLRSVDTLRGSAFGLGQPDDFVAGASPHGSRTPSRGGYGKGCGIGGWWIER